MDTQTNGGTNSTSLDPSDHEPADTVSRLRAGLLAFEEASTEERQRFAQMVLEIATSDSVGSEDIELVHQVVEFIEPVDRGVAVGLCDDLVSALTSNEALSARADLLENIQWLEGLQRRYHLVGQKLDLAGKTAKGRRFDWEKYRGRVVLVDFWATWCTPCIQEMQTIQRLHEQYNASGFDVVGIATDDNPQHLARFLHRAKLPWTTIHSPIESRGAISRLYGVNRIPRSFLVDRDGSVLSTSVEIADLQALLEQGLLDADADSSPVP